MHRPVPRYRPSIAHPERERTLLSRVEQNVILMMNDHSDDDAHLSGSRRFGVLSGPKVLVRP